MDGWIKYRWMVEWIEGKNGWVDGKKVWIGKNGWLEGQKEKKMDGWLDIWIGKK